MTTEDVHRFGERVRGWRYDNRWTQQRLAEALGYDVSYVAKIEQGRRRPSRQFVARLNEVLAPTGQDLPKIWRQPSERVRLPVPPAPLIGRDGDVARICAALQGSSRCVTLVGPPGVGKTSVAVEVAWQLADEVRHGACFVPLVDVPDAAAVPTAVAARLGILQRTGDPRRLVIDVLRSQAGLLVLDNFEHVLDARSFVEDLLRETPRLKILVTSREALGIGHEDCHQVPPLAFPDPAGDMPERAEDYPAVDIFVTRARMVRPGFELGDANVRAVAEICARLDGLPLAIGLAASASMFLAPADIAGSLRVRLELPTDDPDQGAARPLTAALAWSWELLQPRQRDLLSRLAVFSGGCTLAAVEAVCADGDDDVLAGVAALARKNLVEVRQGDDGHSRFMLLETVRRFCLERLGELGQEEALRRRHCDYFLALAETAAPHVTGGPEQGEWLRLLDERYPNLASALGWAVANDPTAAVRLGAALWRYFSIRRIGEGRKWLGLALNAAPVTTALSVDRLRVQIGSAVLARLQADLDGASGTLDDALALADHLGAVAGAERALAVLNQGIIEEQRGSFERAEERFGEALAMSRQLGDERGVGHALNCLGVIALHREDHESASVLFLDALTRFRALGDGWSVAFTTTNLGWVAETDDLLAEAGSWYGESRQIWESVGDEHGLARAKADLGRVARRRGDTVEAGALLEDALQIFQRLGDRRLAAACLLELAAVAARRKRRELAALLVGAAEGVRDSLRSPMWPGERRLQEGLLEDLGRAMDEAALQRARRAGRTLSVEDAVELAECGTWPPPVRRRARPPALAFPPAPVQAAPARAR